MKSYFKNLYNKQVSPFGLEVFRISYGLVLFFEVLFIFRYKELFFDIIPFIEKSQMELGIPLFLWMCSIICIIVGFHTRIATIVSYVFTLVFFSTLTSFEYHIHYIYIGVNFLMIFLPLGNALSIDQVRLKTKVKTVSKLHYFLPVFIGIALVYFDSFFFKIKSEMWLNGNGLWLPASVPHVSLIKSQAILNSEFLMKSVGYFTLFFEFIFIFLFWFKKVRLPLFIIGILLHLGILFVFPIPLFAFGVSAIYLLMVPIHFWERLMSVFKMKIIYEGLTLPTFRIKQLWFFLGIVCFFQLNSTLNFSPAISPISSKIYSKLSIKYRVMKVAKIMEDFSSKTLGIAPHGVFVDSHFKDYNHIIAVTYKDKSNNQEIWLPFINQDGGVGDYIEGSNWAYLSFRVNGPNINQKKLELGLVRLTAFWAKKNGISLQEDVEFNILVKKINLPANFQWQKNVLSKERSRPWRNGGTLSWSNNFPVVNIVNIEEL